MYTALLIDGTKEPIGFLIDQQEPFIVWGGAVNQSPRQFKFVRSERGDKVTVLLYRLHSNGGLTDATFEQRAKEEADKYLHPEKYKDRTDNPVAELEDYKRRYGPLKKQVA